MGERKTRTVRVNCNETVTVTLTEYGAEVLNQRDRMFDARFPSVHRGMRVPNFSGQIYKSQFWCLMNDFGPAMRMGRQVPFSPLEIEFAIPELEQ